MISPSYSLTATERVLPRLALDFTTASLDPRVTFTRSGNTATVINSSGVIVGVNADIPRFDYNPTTLLCNGLLIEESRTNVLLNSLLDGTDLATQSVTVTAAARTLSFYGTGQIVLSGAHSATVTGTGAYPTRTTLTFTPSAGTLTLTVTGTVQFAQLEAGAFATSYIPTEASALTRNADVATMTGTNFSDWFNATEGAMVATASVFQTGVSFPPVFVVWDGTTQNQMRISLVSSTLTRRFSVTTLNAGQADFNGGNLGNFAKDVPFTIAGAYKVNDFAGAAGGGAVSTDTVGTVPTVTSATFGLFNSYLNGHIQKVAYYPQRLTNAELSAFTK